MAYRSRRLVRVHAILARIKRGFGLVAVLFGFWILLGISGHLSTSRCGKARHREVTPPYRCWWPTSSCSVHEHTTADVIHGATKPARENNLGEYWRITRLGSRAPGLSWRTILCKNWGIVAALRNRAILQCR